MGGKIVGHRAAYRLRTHIVRVQGVRHRTHRHRVRHRRTARQGVSRGDVGRLPRHVGKAARRARALADGQRYHAVRVRGHIVGFGIDGRAAHTVRDGDRHRDVLVGHQLVRAVANHRRVAQFRILGGHAHRQQQDHCQDCRYFLHILWVLFVSVWVAQGSLRSPWVDIGRAFSPQGLSPPQLLTTNC